MSSKVQEQQDPSSSVEVDLPEDPESSISSQQSLGSSQTNKVLRIINEVSTEQDPEKILESIFEIGMELTDASSGAISMLETKIDENDPETPEADQDVQTLKLKTYQTNDEETISENEKKELALMVMQEAIEKGKAVTEQNLEGNLEFQELQEMQQSPPSALLTVPLSARGNVFGTLYLAKHDSDDGETGFEEEEISLTTILSNQGAIALESALRYQSSIEDSETGVYSHNYFLHRLKDEVQKANRLDGAVSLLLVDADELKHLSDIVGSEAKNKVFSKVGELLQDELREYDTPARTDSLSGRYGGDEFEVLLTGTGKEEAQSVAGRILETIRNTPFRVDDQTISVTLSIGIASFPEDANDAHELIEMADRALLLSKQEGGDQYHAFDARDVEVEEKKKEILQGQDLGDFFETRNNLLIKSALSDIISSGLEIDQILQITLQTMLDLTGADRGAIVLEDEEIYSIKAQYLPEVSDEILTPGEDEDQQTLNQELVEHTLKQEESLLIGDAPDDLIHQETASWKQKEEGPILVSPLQQHDNKMGLVYLENNNSDELFTEKDQNIIRSLCNQIANHLQNAWKHQQKVSELNIVREKYKQVKSTLQQRSRFQNIVGKSEPMQEVFDILEKVIPTNLNVVVQGETGTGKELAARAIHFNGPRRENPFLAVNCARFSESLLESELFGHMKGSFTGADRDRAGLFEQADEGTLFLDEIGDMSQPMQAKLLRVIETGTVRRIGDDKERNVDVRLISASNKNLKQLCEKNKFREDLYYRLKDAQIYIPPLRERKEDIPLLVEHFLKELAEEEDEPVKQASRKTIQSLMREDWPGNVRQLRSKVRQMAIFAGDKKTIHLPGDKSEPEPTEQPYPSSESEEKNIVFLEDPEDGEFRTLEDLEKEGIRHALQKTDNNKKEAADLLGISTATIYRKIRQYNIEEDED